MQTRLSFNSGEVDEGVALRQDLEATGRSALTLENWEVEDAGGLRRRRGMRRLQASERGARLLGYTYSFVPVEGVRYLVELTARRVRVLGLDGSVVREIDAQAQLGHELDPAGCRAMQVNALLIVTSLKHAPFVIKWDGKGEWTVEDYKFRNLPWRSDDDKDEHVTLVNNGGKLSVEFAAETSADERAVRDGDILRLSWWTEQQETRGAAADIVKEISVVDKLPTAAFCVKGVKFAMRIEKQKVQYWVCKEDWDKSKYYTAGLDDPGSYTNFFQQAENTAGYSGATLVTSVNDLPATDNVVARGTKFGMKVGYWEFFTCIKDVDKELASGATFTDYPEYFVRGVEVGDALACGGRWSFNTSGVWYGSYEVRRNYKTSDIASPDWETRGTSFSHIGNLSQTEITGDESEEECWLRLFITRSRYMRDGDCTAGFPTDGCDNKLVVESYRHDEVLRASVKNGATSWTRAGQIQPALARRRRVSRWSWAAFSGRYGYPLLCCKFSKRLIFAATEAQPQTLWFSQTDDLNNFFVGDGESGAFVVSLDTKSQNPLCWAEQKRSYVLLGTSECEWVLGQATTSGAISAKNINIENHSYRGSALMAAAGTSDKILFVERGGGRVYEYGYSMESDGYISRDLNALATHITSEHGGIKALALTIKPRTTLYCVLGDGQVGVCSYNAMQEVRAWGRWVTEGKVLDVCAMTNGDAADLVYFLVERDGDVWIEVYSAENEYVDAGVRDYASVLVTNALENFLETEVEQRLTQPIWVRLGAEFANEAGAMQVSHTRSGDDWVNIDRHEEVLKEGWHELVAIADWQHEDYVGIRVSGRRGCVIRALQG